LKSRYADGRIDGSLVNSRNTSLNANTYIRNEQVRVRSFNNSTSSRP
jgi:hypothetical protein